MKQIIRVARYEMSVITGGPLFWIFTLLLPLLISGFNIALQNRAVRAMNDDFVASIMESDVEVIGYVDRAGLIATIPADIDPERLRAFANETDAASALEAEELPQYFVIEPDYLQTGQITAVSKDALPLTLMLNGEVLEWVLTYNLMADKNKAILYSDPIPDETTQLIRVSGESDFVQDNSGFLLVIFTFAFMFLFSGGQYILRSISRESENRTLEILLLSVHPRQFIWGKLLGLSSVALLQMLIWGLVVGQLNSRFRVRPTMPDEIVDVSMPLLNANDVGSFPLDFYLWVGLFLFAGFFMMTALMLVIGVMSPKSRFAVQISSLIMVIMMFAFMLNTAVIYNSDSGLALFLSLFPFTAPISMTTRLVVSEPPLWQMLLSLGGIGLTIYLLIRLASRLIRADTLLTGVSLPIFSRFKRS